jgi:hypothetical protein
MRLSRAPLLFLALPVFAAFGACNGSSSPPPSSACSSIATEITQACGLSLATLGAVIGTPFATESACTVALSLPGAPPSAAFTQCANAVAATSCADGLNVPECALFGTLAAGTDCNEDIQCASNDCVVPNGATCGTCGAVISDGQPCPNGTGCRSGATCLSGTCTEVTYGNAGTKCDGRSGFCAADLYCDGSGVCATLPGSGQPCGTAFAFGGVTGGTVCAASYGCDGATCAPLGAIGSACPCQAGLTCARPLDGGAGSCTAGPAPLAPGAACTAFEACGVGRCDAQTMKCPTVIADGQPCTAGNAAAVCGTTSACVSGTCAEAASTIAVCQ